MIKTITKREIIWLTVLSAIYAIGWTMGRYFLYNDYYSGVNGENIRFFVVLGASFAISFAGLFLALYFFGRVFKNSSGIKMKPLIFLLVIAAGMVLYTIIFYPGVSFTDGFRQLYGYYGYDEWTNHDPAISTIIIGAIHQFGSLIGGTEFGFFLFAVILQVLSLYLFWRLIRYMNSAGMPLWFCIITAVYYAIFPTIRLYSITLCKDTGFALAVMWLIFIFIDFYKKSKKRRSLKKSIFIVLAVCLFIMVNFRNDGVYVAIISMTAFLICIKGKRLKIISLVYIGGLIAFHVIYGLVLPLTPVQKGSVREALSVPLQQTAVYIRDYPEEISKEDWDRLTGLFERDPKDVAKVYDPDISDPVKFKFKKDASTDDVIDYFGIWREGLVKHPAAYLKTYANGYYGYFYPARIGSEKYFYNWAVTDNYKTGFNLSYGDYRRPIEEKVVKIIDNIQHLPVFMIFVCPGFFTWVLLFCYMVLFAKKKRRALFCLVPLLGVLIVACISPVNCRIRYILSLVFALPLMIAFAAEQAGESVIKDNS